MLGTFFVLFDSKRLFKRIKMPNPTYGIHRLLASCNLGINYKLCIRAENTQRLHKWKDVLQLW